MELKTMAKVESFDYLPSPGSLLKKQPMAINKISPTALENHNMLTY